MFRCALAGLAVFALAGCSLPRVTPEDANLQPIDGLYEYGAAGRDLKLVVSGSPFAVPPEALAASVERSMDGASSLQPPVRPRLNPDSSSRPNYQLVIAFQPGSLDGPALCSGAQGSVQPSESVQVEAAFCISGRAYRYAMGSVHATGPDDPAFRDLMKQVGLAVFRRDEAKWTTVGGDAASR